MAGPVEVAADGAAVSPQRTGNRREDDARLGSRIGRQGRPGALGPGPRRLGQQKSELVGVVADCRAVTW